MTADGVCIHGVLAVNCEACVAWAAALYSSQRADAAERALAAYAAPCEWREAAEDGCWVPSCGETSDRWVFGDRGPVGVGMRFCGYCGHRIEVVPVPERVA